MTHPDNASTPSSMVERYLVLALRLGQHVDGFVDAYHGPADLARSASDDPKTPGVLASEAEALLMDVASLDGVESRRRRWLEAQIRACALVARRAAGAEMSWSDEVEQCFGVAPSSVPERDLERAHALADAALPGNGALLDRYRRWINTQTVPRETLVPAAERLTAVFRERAEELVTLPADEAAEFDLIEGEPWSAYHYYLGRCRSRVAINADTPVWASWLTDLVSHELYPGHHTERVCKEVALVGERGYLEETLMLTLAPQSLVAEGIAMLGLEVLLGAERHAVAADALKPLGIAYDAEAAAAVEEADRMLEGVIVNAARQVHEEGVSIEAVREYLLHWRLRPPETIDRTIAFVTDRTWRTYVSTYVDGLRLCRQFVGQDKRRFVRLLTEQLTPQDLLEEV